MEKHIKSKYRSGTRLQQHQQKHQQYNYRYFRRSSFHWPNYIKRSFVQYPLWARQRLIPLTSEIRKIMMEFRHAGSDVSVTDKRPLYYNTLSITSLVREEVHNMLNELAVTDKFIRKEEIDDLIEKCLKEKVTIVHEGDSGNSTAHVDSDTDLLQQDIEVTVEMLNESDKNKLIVENFQILEQRITTLEDRLSSMLQNIPKIRQLQAAKFKINTNAIKEELRSIINRIDLRMVPNQNTPGLVANLPNDKVTNEENATVPASIVITETTTTTAITRVSAAVAPALNVGAGDRPTSPMSMITLSGHRRIPTSRAPMFYDDLYYAGREYAMNLLNYKKSTTSLQLNERAKLNPYIRPSKFVLPQPRVKPKQRPRFIDPDNFE